MRYFWLSFGLINVGLGIAGTILPLVPTTPFILLAAFCFARSSPRFHRWLVGHRIFGPMIRNWNESGAVSLNAKIAGSLAMAAAIIVSYLLALDAIILIIQGVVMVGVLSFLWTRPTPERADIC